MLGEGNKTNRGSRLYHKVLLLKSYTVTDSQEEANELQTRADLMIVIRDIVNHKGWKQTEVAEKLALTQPRVSYLLNGKIEKFSIDLLMTCLFRLGYRFKPTYKNHKLTMTVKAA